MHPKAEARIVQKIEFRNFFYKGRDRTALDIPEVPGVEKHIPPYPLINGIPDLQTLARRSRGPSGRCPRRIGPRLFVPETAHHFRSSEIKTLRHRHGPARAVRHGNTAIYTRSQDHGLPERQVYATITLNLDKMITGLARQARKGGCKIHKGPVVRVEQIVPGIARGLNGHAVREGSAYVGRKHRRDNGKPAGFEPVYQRGAQLLRKMIRNAIVQFSIRSGHLDARFVLMTIAYF